MVEENAGVEIAVVGSRVLLAAVFLTVLASPSRADLEDFYSSASFDLGMAVPLTSLESGYGSIPLGKASPSVGAGYLYQTESPFAFGGRISYVDFGRAEKSSGKPSAPLNLVGSSTQLLLQALGRWEFQRDKPLSPYLITGLGISQFKGVIRGKPGKGFIWPDTLTNEDRDLIRDSITGFAISFGVGLDFAMGERFQGAFDLMWNDAQVEAVGNRKGYSIGLGFHLGWKLD